jgi:hypothetical protein
MGDNIHDQIRDAAYRYSESLKRSAEENDYRAGIRDEMEGIGLDTKAFQDRISRMKKDLNKKEGYDEADNVIKEALKDDTPEDLFKWQIQREEKKREEQEARKAEKEEQKAKDDEYKPAPERKPKQGKSVSGKDAAAGEKADDDAPSVGEQQAAAFTAANNKTVN